MTTGPLEGLEAREWADGMLLSLEAGNAEPTDEQWAELRAQGIEYDTFVRSYGRAIERIDAYHAALRERLGDFTDAAEIERMAARASLAVALALLSASRLDVQNARAERDRAEQMFDHGPPGSDLDADGRPVVRDEHGHVWHKLEES